MKKHITRAIAFALLLALLLSLASCGGTPNELSSEPEVIVTDDNSITPDVTAETTPTPDEPILDDEPTEPPEHTPTGRGEIRTGEWSGDGMTFTNDWPAIKLTLPDDSYIITTEEKVNELVEIAGDALGEDILAADLTKRPFIYDFYINNQFAFLQFILLYENLNLTLGFSNITEDEYINIMNSQFEELKVNDMPIFTEIGRDTVTFADIEWTHVEYLLNNMRTLDYYLHYSDDYMWKLTNTYDSETAELAAELIACISAA